MGTYVNETKGPGWNHWEGRPLTMRKGGGCPRSLAGSAPPLGSPAPDSGTLWTREDYASVAF